MSGRFLKSVPALKGLIKMLYSTVLMSPFQLGLVFLNQGLTCLMPISPKYSTFRIDIAYNNNILYKLIC